MAPRKHYSSATIGNGVPGDGMTVGSGNVFQMVLVECEFAAAQKIVSVLCRQVELKFFRVMSWRGGRLLASCLAASRGK